MARPTADPAERLERGLGAGALWALVGASACACVSGLEPNLVEEGLVLHFAQRILRGEHLYRDLVFFSGPLPFELLAALFRVFGEEIAVGRAAQAILLGAATGATFALARRAGAASLAHLAAAIVASAPILLFPMFSIFYYTPLAFSLGTLAALAASRAANSLGFAVTAGALAGAVALCKQTLGGVLAVTLLACIAAAAPVGARRTRAAATVLGGAAAAAATLVWYAARSDLAALFRCLVTLPLSLGDSYTSPLMSPWPPGRLAPELASMKAIYFPNLWVLLSGIYAEPGRAMVAATQLLYALPLLALAATGLARVAMPLPTATWCNAGLLLALTTNLFPRADWGHLVIVLPTAAVQVLLLLSGPAARAARSRPRALPSVAATGVFCLAGVAAPVGFWLHGESTRPTFGPRVPLRPVSDVYQGPGLPRVIHFLRERIAPNEAIFVARAEPLVYFATGATNPTPYGGVLPVLNEEQEARILEALPRVRYVVMSDIDQPMWTYYADELPRVQEHLERYYHVPRYFPLDQASWIVVLERGADRGETAIDLIAERPRSRAFVRNQPGEESDDSAPLPRLIARQNRRPLATRIGRFGGGIDFELELPRNAHFETDVGLRTMPSLEALHASPTRSRIRVSLRRRGMEFEEIASWRTDDRPEEGKRWIPLAADLSAFAGERVTLRLELVPDAPIVNPDLFWWGSPRIALPPEAAAPGPGGDAPPLARD